MTAWKPISAYPYESGKCYLVRAKFPLASGKEYVTDPYVVFYCDGQFQRWVHRDVEPTEWCEIPE